MEKSCGTSLTKARTPRPKPLSYHLHTVWLFTRSDIKTTLIPSTIFGIIGLLSGPILTTNSSPELLRIIKRLPVILFWVWINLLPFNIDNQRQPDSLKEDRENKGWRPLPSQRIKLAQATNLMRVLYGVAVVSSIILGGLWQCLGLIGLGYWYNGLKGGENNCFIRNLINACGYSCFLSGALQVGSDRNATFLLPVAYEWFVVIGFVVFTTVQAQDIQDQVGDSLRNRCTIPLIFGDLAARWTVAIPLWIWSWVCPVFWGLGMIGFLAPVLLSTVINLRYLLKRSIAADELTFRIYNLWIVSLYTLPLVARVGRFQQTNSE